MDEKVILQVLSEQKEEAESYKYKQWIPRKEEEQFEWESHLAQVVTGVRRSGKSTLCHKVLLQKGVRYAYADMNDDRLMGIQTEDLNKVLSCFYQLYGTDVEYIFLDEIQDVEGWNLFVNRLMRNGIHVVLTGSNARLMSSELSTYMTGRYNEIRLYPFSYREYCQYKRIDTESPTTKCAATRKSEMAKYLQDGGMPELLHIQSAQTRRSYMEGLVETVVHKDIARRFNLRNVDGMRRMTHHLMNTFCQPIDYRLLAEMMNVKSIATAQKYVSYLEQAFLIKKVQKFSYKSKERIRDEKCYITDTGFIANRENALVGDNIGWRLENMVCIELLRRHRSEADDVYYYHPTARNKECDFVVCHQGVVKELVQVSYSVADNTTYRREVEGLLEASEKLNCDRLTLICLDDSRDVEERGKTIHIRSAIEWGLQESSAEM